MRLSYRGIAYETTNPEMAAIATTAIGTYRGVSISRKTLLVHQPVSCQTTLKYRGIPYTTL